MKRFLLSLGLAAWSAIFALGGAEAARWWEARRVALALQAPSGQSARFETRKARPLTVPIIRGGKLEGYAAVQLSYAVEPQAAARLEIEIEPYLLDEAFGFLYSDSGFSGPRLESYDPGRLREALVSRLARRLGVDAVRDVFIQEFTYVAASELRK